MIAGKNSILTASAQWLLHYFFFESMAGGGGGATCVAGLVVVEVLTLSKTLLPLLALPLKNIVDVMANTAIMDAKIQVPFSRTSVVCFTPMKLLLNPPTFAFNPPPLGF